MAEFDNMRKSLPVAYRTDKWVCDLLAAIQSLDDMQREQMLDITQQLFPGSMTWALTIEERDAGLASTGTLEERFPAGALHHRGRLGAGGSVFLADKKGSVTGFACCALTAWRWL